MCTLGVSRNKSTFRQAFGSEIMEMAQMTDMIRYATWFRGILCPHVPTTPERYDSDASRRQLPQSSTGVWAPVGNALSVLHWGSYCLTGDGIPSCLCTEGQCEGHKGYCVLIVMRRRKVLASMVKNSKQLSKHIKTIVTCSMIMMWWLRDMQ